MTRVYLDHNATTPMRREVRELLDRTLDLLGGNPSSLHEPGRRARLALDRAREQTAAALGVHEDEIVFTSGGTESNNLALVGALTARGAKSKLVTSAVEHSSVRETAFALERAGHPLAIVGVGSDGAVEAGLVLELAKSFGADVVSIMAANNEVGACMPIAQIGAAKRDWVFHCDAVQALGRIDVPLGSVDLASFSCHKLGGPVGVGVLFRRRGVALAPLFHGGAHESGLRAGTENVAGIVAFALFRLFDIGFPAYFVLLLSGFLFATTLGVLWARRIGQNPDVVVDLGLAMLLAGVAGAFEVTTSGIQMSPISLRLVYPGELELMARIAGLQLLHRWGGWRREPFTVESRRHVSVYGPRAA
jgi:hypothetical protein